MAIRLRFAVHGFRNNRILHLVAIDHRKARNAKPAELLGIYRHRATEPGGTKKLEWSVDRIRYWLSVGAEPSPSVVRLLEMGGILKPGSPYHPAALQTATPAKKLPAKSTQTTKTATTTQSATATETSTATQPATATESTTTAQNETAVESSLEELPPNH